MTEWMAQLILTLPFGGCIHGLFVSPSKVHVLAFSFGNLIFLKKKK